jgi:uncharacterized membrane protein YfcA
MLNIFFYILTGVAAGGLAGLFGLGGGIVIVPALVYIFSQDSHIPSTILMHLTIGSSLASMLLLTQASVRAHYRHNRILWPIYHRMALGLFLGTSVGVILATLLSTRVLMIFFGSALFFMAIEMIITNKPKGRCGLPNIWKTNAISFCIGSVTGLLGVSGGTLTFPFFHRCRLSLRKTMSVVALSSATVALTGTLFFVLIGFNRSDLPPWTIGYVYWPAVLLIAIPGMLVAPFFARLAYRLPLKSLKKYFILYILITSVRMLIQAF